MNIIDLTHPLKEGIPCFDAPWHVPYSKKPLGKAADVGRNTSRIAMGSHTGTHIDAPRHFFDNGNTIDQLNLKVLCGGITVLDMRSLPGGTAVTREMLADIQMGERVLFAFGWCSQWETGGFYSGYPYISPEAADYMVKSGVKLVAMDTPSPDDSRIKLLSEQDSQVHKVLLSHNVILVEYLANTNLIDFSKEWDIFALPINIMNGDGAPARVILAERGK